MSQLSCPPMSPPATSSRTIAFFGPAGTFTEEALFTQPDYAASGVVPYGTLAEVLDAVCASQADLGFVPIENSIEGTVNATVDSLAFEVDLDVHQHLMAPPGTKMADIRRVLSFPVASAQCRRYLAQELPQVDVVPTNSTAEAAR